MLEREKKAKVLKKFSDELNKNGINHCYLAVTDRGPHGVYCFFDNTITDVNEFFNGLCMIFKEIADANNKKLSEAARDFYNFARKFERNVLDDVIDEGVKK